MQKEKFSIRKTTVGAVSARIAVIGLLSLIGLAQEVQADEFVTTSAEVVEAETTVTPETVTPEQVEQARQDLALAQATVAQDQTAVEQALITEQVAKENLALVQEQVQTSQDFLNQATPEVIDEIEATVRILKEKNEELTRDKTVKEAEVIEQESKASEAEQDVQEKERELAQVEETRTQATNRTKEVETGRKELSSQKEKVNEQIISVQTKVDWLTESRNIAQEDYERSLLTEEELEQELSELNSLKDAKIAEWSSQRQDYQKQLNEIRNQISREEREIETLNETIDKLQELIDSGETGLLNFEVSDRYLDALLRRGEFSDEKYGSADEDPILRLYPQGEKFSVRTSVWKIDDNYSTTGEDGTWMYHSDYYSLKGLNENDIYRITVLLEEAEKLADSMYYFPTLEDESLEFETNNPSSEVLLEANRFAINLVQSFIAKTNLKEPKLYQAMLDYVKAHMERTIADNFTGDHHNASIRDNYYILEAAGLGWGSGENIAMSSPTDTMTMAELKLAILDGLHGLLGNNGNQEWRHASNFFKLPTEESEDVSAIVLGFESTNWLRIHFTRTNSRGAVEDLLPLDDTYTETENLADVLARRLLSLEKAITALGETEKAKAEKEAERDEVLEKLIEEYRVLKDRAEDIEVILSLKKNYGMYANPEEAKQKLDQAEEELKQAEEGLEQLTVKLSELEETEGDLTEEIEQLSQILANSDGLIEELTLLVQRAKANATEQNEQAKYLSNQVDNLETELKKVEQQLDDNLNYLFRLQNAEKNNQEAQAELEKAELELEQATNRLKELLEVLETSRQTRDEKQEYLDYLTALLAKQTAFAIPDYAPEEEALPEYVFDPADFLDVLEPSQGEVSDKESLNQAGGAAATESQDKPKNDSLSGIGSSERPVITATATATAPSYSRIARATAEKSLPNTGDSSALLSLVGFGLTAFGLVGRKRRKA